MTALKCSLGCIAPIIAFVYLLMGLSLANRKVIFGVAPQGLDMQSKEAIQEWETSKDRSKARRKVIIITLAILVGGEILIFAFSGVSGVFAKTFHPTPTFTPSQTITITPSETQTITITPTNDNTNVPVSISTTSLFSTLSASITSTPKPNIQYVERLVYVTVIVPNPILITVIVTATFTFTPSLTNTQIASPTYTATPTYTNTSTPTYTDTPTLTQTPTDTDTTGP